jgi:hypothetical protein
MISNKSARLVFWAASVALAIPTINAQTLPWERKIPLWQAAQTITLESTLNATNPTSRSGMSINNLKMHTVLWGPANRITISLNKNNVWDRRLHETTAGERLALVPRGNVAVANILQ